MTLPYDDDSQRRIDKPKLSIVHCQLSIPNKEVLLCRIYMT